MDIIVAADENWGIGRDNSLLARIPADMKRFREMTTGNAIVMGRNTYLSFPKRPLPNRENFVITSRPELFPEVRCFNGAEEFKSFSETYEGRIFVCGGGQLYKALLPFCERAYITRILSIFSADTFFPDMDKEAGWEIEEQSDIVETNGINIRFVTYVNRALIKDYFAGLEGLEALEEDFSDLDEEKKESFSLEGLEGLDALEEDFSDLEENKNGCRAEK